MALRLGRRTFLSSLGAAGAAALAPQRMVAAAATTAKGVVGSLSSPGYPMVDGHPIVTITKGLGSTGNIHEEIGIVPVVNSGGTVTVIGGSVMKPEVMEAIRQGNMHFCVLDDLELKAGRWMATKCKAPEGMSGLVVGGAAAAILVGYAGMMTQDYMERITSIPDLTHFPKTEVIIQRTHRYPFDHQIRQTGAKLIVVESRDEMIRAINPRTVAIHFTNILSAGGVNGPDTVAIAKQHGVYTFNDASADVPPKERLWEYPAVGFDLTTFSGGKDICGPQAAGLLIGKEELLRFALLNMSPQEDRIGRVCKVGKETIFGLLKAVEMFVDQDYAETLAKYDRRAKTITDALAPYGVTAEPRRYDETALGNVAPHYSWTWDPEKVKITSAEIQKKLSETRPVAIGTPSGSSGAAGLGAKLDPNWPKDAPDNAGRESRIGEPKPAINAATAAAAGGGRRGGGARGGGSGNSWGCNTWLLKDGEDRYIANRLVQIFNEAGVKRASGIRSAKSAAKKS